MRGLSAALALVATCAAGMAPNPVSQAPRGAAPVPMGVLLSVTAIAADDVWAVGKDGADDSSLTEHWDGTSWQRFPSPTLGRETSLRAVSASSADDVWAAGTWYTGKHYFRSPIVLHWDGSSWTQVQFPAIGLPTSLSHITALSRRDVWVVGTTQSHSIAYHWDGAFWTKTKVKHHANELGYNSLSSIDAVDRDTLWTVGSYSNSGDKRSPMIQSWQGDHWKLEDPVNPPFAYVWLEDVEAVARAQVWVVGWGSKRIGSSGFIEQWNGSRWALMPVRNLPRSSEFEGVGASSATDAWVVGNAYEPRGNKALIAHWNGVSWRVVPTPRVNGHAVRGSLYAVAALSSSDAWAVGYDADQDGVSTILLHWDGSSWTLVNADS